MTDRKIPLTTTDLYLDLSDMVELLLRDTNLCKLTNEELKKLTFALSTEQQERHV